MDINFFLRGLIIGLVIAVPVGPIGLLCIHRTLTEGRIHGLISGFGAATVDAIYGAITVLGLMFISSFLVEQQLWFRIIGAAFLCGLGIRIFFSKAAKKPSTVNGKSLAANYGSTFFIALMNPMTILAFTAVFAGLGITTSNNNTAGLLIAGVFVGSCIWWILLSSTVGFFRKKIMLDNLAWLNRISGIIITTFGFLLFFNLMT